MSPDHDEDPDIEKIRQRTLAIEAIRDELRSFDAADDESTSIDSRIQQERQELLKDIDESLSELDKLEEEEFAKKKAAAIKKLSENSRETPDI